MASVSSIRSKEWRTKRKDDADYWEQERKRKRKARQSRSEEKKQHDRELSKKRQKRFRERKKSAKCNVTLLPLNIAAVNDRGRVPAISDDVRSSGELAILPVSNPNTFHVSMDTDLDKGPVDSVCELAEIEEEGGPVLLYNFDGNNWHKKSKPLTEQCGNKGAEGMASISVTGGEGREAYFKRIQASLSEVEDFDLLQMKCNEFSHQIEEMYPIENLPTLDVTGYQLDNVASSLYPHEDAPDDFVPIRTVGDGNCLPRVGSLFAFGNEKHHNEIRVRMFIELCRYEHYYLDDSYLKRGTEQGLVNISKTLALFSDVFVPHEEDGVRLAFRQYVKNILKTNSFNGMWSIFALSSVLGVQALSIYPSYGGYNVRPDLHRLVMPRVFRQEKSKTVHIMWTSTHGKQVEPKSWTPNHFVAVLPTLDRRPTPRENDDLPMQHEQSGSQPITDSISSTIPVLGSVTIESLSSNYDASVESPTTHLLNSVCKRDEKIGTNGKAHSGTTLLAPTDHMNIGDPTRANSTFLSHSDERDVFDDMIEHEAMDLRGVDRCQSHTQEQLVYLCKTCGELPICYKCHLESHQQHTFTDLKMYLAANERMYLQKITKKHEENLKKEIKHQKQVHVENMESIDKEIETVFAHYNGLLEKKSESSKKIEDQIRILESMLEDTDTFTDKERGRLKSLPVPERLSVMTAEPRADDMIKGQAHAHLVLFPGPAHLLDQLGALEEIPYHAELSKASVSVHASNRPGVTRDIVPHSAYTVASGSQYQWNEAVGDRRIPACLTTDHFQEMSGGSTSSSFPGQTYVYCSGSTIPYNSDQVNRVSTDTCTNVVPLMNHGLKGDRTFSASQMSRHMEIAVTNDISALSTQNYQPLSYGNSTHNHHQQSSAISTVSNHNDQPLSHGISTESISKDQPLSYGIQTAPPHKLQPLGNGTSALSTVRDQPPVYGIRAMTHTNDQWFCAEATAIEFPNKQRVIAIPTVSTFNDQNPTYTRPETPRQHGGSQTIHQQHREQMMFNPEENGLSIQPTDSAVDNTMLRPRVFTVSSEIEPDTCTQGTKNKTTLLLEYCQSGQENVNLLKSDSNNTDNDTLCVRGSDLSVDVSVKRTMRDITHKITIPESCRCLDVFRSVGNKLYVWKRLNSTRVLQINKDGNQHTIIDLKSKCVRGVCVSAIDSTVWFVCRNGRVRCVSPTGTVKTKFTINARPLLLCVTCSGDVLVLDYNRLTLYTVSGEVVHSTECSNEAWVIRECSQTRNIMACTLDYPGIIALYDNRLKKKLSIEGGTITYPDGHTSDVGYDMQHVNDVCFDKEGNILISCDSGHVILIDHTNGRYIRTVLSDCIGLWRMDVDDEGVMWCLCIDGEVKCFHL
ncbi:uncharacterized protein LOC110447792 [Mizuhopecten yessoensis]|uniref:uncharacterized protein LOC110447792 n=1 Tax=Mizuhopecten yessoensis TaxID=6573 RepID=UPI000B4584E9|nr:uncharacterized protein LOC110447792 [Mizuhopecten yessoensis]XP_021349380.1 uncharacterized protein LOC110447792 [Mizuhopecten yessoensis]XP_021349382.1 uncharacterized protein LOC110447792 [Mizuhopecten yessoensis]